MNFDELMKVWRSQDAAPLHDVNKARLQQALQQDAAALQKARGRERRIHYLSSAFVIGLLAILLILMIQGPQRYMMTGWDYLLGIGGVAAALFAGGIMYASHRAQVRREQGFGNSLRDQINRRIAQVDGVVAGARRRAVSFVLMGAICPLAILHFGMRINHKSLSDVSVVPVALVVLCFVSGARSLRRSVHQAAARKLHLKDLLAELDGQ
jgi:hypothetical protein